MVTQKVFRRMKIAIITLSVLLFLSVSVLLGVLLYQYSVGGGEDPAVAPDNIIKSEGVSFRTVPECGVRLARVAAERKERSVRTAEMMSVQRPRRTPVRLCRLTHPEIRQLSYIKTTTRRASLLPQQYVSGRS